MRKYNSMSGDGIKQAVQQQFGSVAANYTTSAVHARGADLHKMVEHARLPANARILDAGCGAGHTALAFAPHVAQVVAYDLTPPMLAQVVQLAQARGITNVETRVGDVEQLPFDDVVFDAVVSRYSAHHWVQPEKALTEFARVLKPGGQLIVSDVTAPDDYTADTFLQTLELLRDASHVRDHSVAQWLNMLHAAGFRAEVIYRFEIPLHFGQWLQRIATPPVYASAIRALMTGAPLEMKRQFHLPEMIVTDDFEFQIDGAVFSAVLA